jgi:hypothetical protein
MNSNKKFAMLLVVFAAMISALVAGELSQPGVVSMAPGARARITPHDIFPVWPWAIAVIMSICYGLLGQKHPNAGSLWALSGGLVGLVVASLTAGLAVASTVPCTVPIEHQSQLKAFVLSAVVLGLLALGMWQGPGLFARYRTRARA